MSENPTTDAAVLQPVRGWVLLAAPIASLILLVAISIGGFVAYAFSFHSPPASADIEIAAATLVGNFKVLIGIGILQYVTLLFCMWLFVPKRGPRSLGHYFPSVPGKTIALIATGAVVFGIVLIVLQWSLDHFDIIRFPDHPEDVLLRPKTIVDFVLLLILGSVFAPLIEELYFRGLFLRWLQSKMPLLPAALINAVLFSAIHGYFAIHPGADGWFETGGVVVVGLIMVALVVQTGSLWASMAFHAAYNGFAITTAFIATHHF